MCDGGCPMRRPAGGETLRVVGPSRREFIARSALAAVAALLTGACGDGVIGGVGPGGVTDGPPPVLGQGFTIRIADFPALQQVGGIARVDGNTTNPIAVTRLGATSFVALSMICPHAGYRPIGIVAGGFRCPVHEAQFAGEGTWTGGQRTTDMQSYPTTYNAGAGTLTIG